jgi:hypothetical protein
VSPGAFGQPLPGEPGGGFGGTGVYAEATPTRQASAFARHDADLAAAQRAGRHYWQAIAQFALSETDVRAVVGQAAATPTLDTENLLGIMVGCYVCEQVATPALIGSRCPGDPS